MTIDMHRSDDMGNVYTLREPIHYRELTVPVGFESDGASVPRFFWRLVFPPGDVQALRAAFLHDFIYRTHPEGWDRAKADDLFYEVLVADGVPKWRAWLAWSGVRLGGASAWNKAKVNPAAEIHDREYRNDHL